MDYIYQGPIILVLLVSAHWELGQGWAPGGQQRTHPAEMLAKDVAWSAPPPRCPPAHTLYRPPPLPGPRPQLPLPLSPHPDAAPSPRWPSGAFSGQRMGLNNGRFLAPPTPDNPLPGAVLRHPGEGPAGGRRRVCRILFSPDLDLPPPAATPSRAQPTAPSLEQWGGTQCNEQLFLVQLPALRQMYSHLNYNCRHVFNPARALIKVEVKQRLRAEPTNPLYIIR